MKAFTSMEDSGTQWLAGKEKANKRIQGQQWLTGKERANKSGQPTVREDRQQGKVQCRLHLHPEQSEHLTLIYACSEFAQWSSKPPG